MRKKINILLLLIVAIISSMAAQGNKPVYTIEGFVVDETGDLLPSVTIYLKDRPGVGTLSDIDGKFSIKASRGDVIVFSFVGFSAKEHLVEKDTKNLEIKLSSSSLMLDEAVVVGAVGVQRKISVVGAISSVSAKQLDIPATNIVNSLGGRVPGIVALQSSGEPGKNLSEFWVRGIGTFGASSGALVLIDGLEGNLNEIDPADIESFSVLKDASATAVYGSRGANGVVLVTTKRGEAGKLNISTRSNITMSTLNRLPKYLRSYDYARLANEARFESGLTPLYDEVDLEAFKYGLAPNIYPDIDWQAEMLKQSSVQQTHFVNARGGGSVARYYLSLGLSMEPSAYKMERDSKYASSVAYNTYNYRANLDMNITESTVVYFGTNGYLANTFSPSMGSSYNPMSPSTTDWLWEAQASTTPVSFPKVYPGGYYSGYGASNEMTPFVMLNYSGVLEKSENHNLVTVAINQQLDKLTKGLNLRVQASLDHTSRTYKNRFYQPALYKRNGGYSREGEISLTKVDTEKEMTYSKYLEESQKIYFESNLGYDRLFADVHRVGFLMRYYLQSSNSHNSDGATNNLSQIRSFIPRRYQGLAGRLMYGFDDTYFVDFNFGLNGSENFKPGSQYGFFPSVALGWVLTNYDFMRENLRWFSFCKIRGSYGEVGNDAISNDRFPYMTTIISNQNAGSPWGGTGILNEERVGADNLVWEKAKKWNLGFDLKFLKDNLSATIDIFNDVRDGIFQQRTQVPDFVGAVSMPYGNVGSMMSWGSDGNVEYFQKLNKDMSFTLRANYLYSLNKVLRWEEPQPRYSYLQKSGYMKDIQRGYISLGLFEDDLDVLSSPTQFGVVRPGDIKYKDVNGDGVINEDDMVPLFAPFGIFDPPVFSYGIGGSFMYKSFTLNFLFRGIGDRHFFWGGSDGGRFDGYMPFNRGERGNVLSIANIQENRWTSKEFSGDASTENPNARFPRLSYGNNLNNTKPSTFWIGNAKYLKLQEVSVNYHLRMSSLQRATGINSIDFQLVGDNLYIWDNVKLVNPEQIASSGQAYPIPLRLTFQMYLNF